MKQTKTRAFSLLLVLVMVFSLISPGSSWKVNAEEQEVSVVVDSQTEEKHTTIHQAVIEYLHTTVVQPTVSSTGGEWAVLALARSGVQDPDWYNYYYEQVVSTLEDNGTSQLHRTKSTDNSRVIIGLTAIGQNPADVAGYDLLEPLADFSYVPKQGINGPIYALIAFDCGNYDIPEAEEGVEQTTREKLIDYILDKELENGGWALSGTAADPDITAMAVQALAPYYNNNDEVKTAVDQAIIALSDMQRGDGGFASWGSVNAESCAQVLCALCALGIDADEDARFIKDEGSVLDALLSYYDESTGGFKHTATTAVNGMATEQAAYALTAYCRLKNGAKGLYEMSDVKCIMEGHQWDEGKVVTEATVDKGGEKQYTCIVCGEIKTESIPKIEQSETEKPKTEQSEMEKPKAEQPETGQPGTGSSEEQQPSSESQEEDTIVTKPKKTKISKLSSPKKKQIKVTWKKQKEITGYQLQVSTTSKFKKKETKTYKINKQSKTTKTIKSLKSKKKYYVRIRTYKTQTVKGKKVTKYSSWSAKKKVTVK